ncbi:acetolactate synthase catalytic subunit [Rhizobium sp. BR 362]|uniref:acetolactate synthase catalytic subunit n=1 Tax=Rhizobium sp. BR 362 TaxID=3040670 RepID=UPI002F3EF746
MIKTVADVVAAALKRHGIDIIFGQSNPTALMLAAERIGIRQVFYRTENAAGVMADGYSRVSNRISAIALQNGPAATLAVAPMAEALKASIPMLVLAQEVPASQRDRNAFQELDHFALFEGVSKWTRRIDDPSRAEDYVDLAIGVANSGRPGPVVLLLPKDVLNQQAEPSRFPRTVDLGRFPLDRPRPQADAVARAAELLAKADAPVVIAGGGVHVSDAVSALTRLQTVGYLPVATTNMGKGAIDEAAPLSVGVAANVTGKRGPVFFHKDIVSEADVVLFVGTRTNENGTDGWTLTSPNARYIHIDIDALEVGRNYESLRLVGDARSALTDLADALQQCDLEKRRAASAKIAQRIADGRRRHKDVMAPLSVAQAHPILPEKLLADLDTVLRRDDIVVADASYASIWVSSYLTARGAGQRFLLPRGLAGLGWGLPLGMGAKLASPNSRVVALVGDGGFAHVWSELETCVRENVPLVVVVLNNNILAYQRHAENAFFGETTSAIEFVATDHAAIARAVGAQGERITNPENLLPSLQAAMDSGRTVVLDVLVDPNAYAPVRVWDNYGDRINA